MTIRKLLLGAMALAVLAGPAIAQAQDTPPPPAGGPGGPGGHPPMGGMDNADTDGDGALSKAEFIAVHEKRFEEMDGNHDGKVSKDEMKAHRESMKAKFEAKRKEWEAKKGADAPVPPAPAK